MNHSRFLACLALACSFAFGLNAPVDAQPQRERTPIIIDFSTSPDDYEVVLANGTTETYSLHDLFREAQTEFSNRIIGYRVDVPRAVLANLEDGLRIAVGYDFIDGVGGTLAFAGPRDIFTFGVSAPSIFTTARSWSFARTGAMTIDIDDIDLMLIEEIFVDVIVHEAMHAIGFGTLFEQNNLNGVTNLFGHRNFTHEGFCLAKYREESQNPFATFVPLFQDDGGGHWDWRDPFFYQPQNGIQDVMIPFAPEPPAIAIVTETTWAAFADLGYKVRKINAPGLPGQ